MRASDTYLNLRHAWYKLLDVGRRTQQRKLGSQAERARLSKARERGRLEEEEEKRQQQATSKQGGGFFGGRGRGRGSGGGTGAFPDHP